MQFVYFRPLITTCSSSTMLLILSPSPEYKLPRGNYSRDRKRERIYDFLTLICITFRHLFYHTLQILLACPSRPFKNWSQTVLNIISHCSPLAVPWNSLLFPTHYPLFSLFCDIIHDVPSDISVLLCHLCSAKF